MDLEAGDKVLLLLPSNTKKFVAKWQGPYIVTKRVRKVNFEIEMPDKGGRKQIFHVNHLSRWKERPCKVNAVIEDGDGIKEYTWTDGEEKIRRKKAINTMLSRYPQVVKDTPGRTNKVTHRIRTTDCIPVRQKPYRIPQAYREEVNKELDEMEQSGIITRVSGLPRW